MASGNSKIRLLFHFGRHITQEDGTRVFQAMKKFRPQVICLESPGYTGAQAKALEKQMAETKGNSPPFQFEIEKGIRGFKARPYFIERHESQEEASHYQAFVPMLQQYGLSIRQAFTAGKPEEALELFHKRLIDLISSSIEREDRIKKKISNLYDELVKRYPELGKEKELRVLITFGSAHTSIYHHARKQGFAEVKRILQNKIFDLGSAYTREIIFGRNPDLTQAKLVRGSLSEFMLQLLEMRGVPFGEATAYSNLAFKKATLDDYQRISEAASKHTQGSFIDKIGRAFQECNVKIPDKDEVKKTLAKR